MFFRSLPRIACVALVVTLPAACTPVCPNGAPPRAVPCQTVVRHRLVGLHLSLDRAVAGWSVRFGGQVMPLGPEGVWIPLSGGDPSEAVVLEGPQGEKVGVPLVASGGEGDQVRSQLALPGDVPAIVFVTWTTATDVSECHGAPPTMTCEGRS